MFKPLKKCHCQSTSNCIMCFLFFVLKRKKERREYFQILYCSCKSELCSNPKLHTDFLPTYQFYLKNPTSKCKHFKNYHEEFSLICHYFQSQPLIFLMIQRNIFPPSLHPSLPSFLPSFSFVAFVFTRREAESLSNIHFLPVALHFLTQPPDIHMLNLHFESTYS